MRISHSKRAGLVAIATAAVFSTHLTALSQPRQRCGPDGYALIEHLESEYDEKLTATATNSRGHRVIWLANDLTGSWSQVVVMPPAVYGQPSPGCLIGSGQDWFIELVAPGEKS